MSIDQNIGVANFGTNIGVIDFSFFMHRKSMKTNGHMLWVPWVPTIVFFPLIFSLRCKKPAPQIVLSRVRLLYNIVIFARTMEKLG